MRNLVFLSLFLLLLTGCNSDKVSNSHSMPNGSKMGDANHEMVKITSQEQFLNEMIPHHQEAIDTSELLLKTTSNTDLKIFIVSVIDVQTKEIVAMKTLLKDLYGKDYLESTVYMPMMGDLTVLDGVMQEMAYINGMLVHHQGAITMAQQVLGLADLKPGIAAMAKNIIEVQTKEITVLEDLYKA